MRSGHSKKGLIPCVSDLDLQAEKEFIGETGDARSRETSHEKSLKWGSIGGDQSLGYKEKSIKRKVRNMEQLVKTSGLEIHQGEQLKDYKKARDIMQST